MAALVYTLLAALWAGGLVRGRPDQELAAVVRQELGPAAQVTVQVTGDPQPGLGRVGAVRVTVTDADARRLPLAALVPVPRPRTPKGRLGRLELTAEHVRLDLLEASRVTFRAEDVVYDRPSALRGELRDASLGRQVVQVVFRDGDLDRYAASAFPELGQAHLTFESGQVVARGLVPLLLAAFPMTISGGLTIAGGTRVLLTDAALDTGRVALTPRMRQGVLRRLDPLLDLVQALQLPVPLHWTGVVLTAGEAQLTGQLTPLEAPATDGAFAPRERYLR